MTILAQTMRDIERTERGAQALDERAAQQHEHDDAAEWPTLDDRALHGLAGEIVRAIAPHTEADRAAILLQTIAAFGALVGPGPYYPVEGDRHRARLFAVLIGATAKGRKGTSWGRVRDIFSRIAESWPREVSGLSSGEGMKWQVRDATDDDPGVADKRLLVVEPEFAQVLRVIARQGNTLSADLRSAWDTGRLATLTKNSPITASDAHISIIAHVTSDELRAELTQTDAANGLANRFLFAAVRRSQCLPFGGEALAESVLDDFARRLEQAAIRARTLTRVQFAEAARPIWARVYPELSEGHGGLYGAVTGRAEAQTVRLALIYALMDGRDAIEPDHLRAALSVWDYCDQSARYVFGAALGDPVADDILRALRANDQMTRTDISHLFRRHQSAERIGAALDLLMRRGLATRETVDTGGRPMEVWRIAKKAKEAK